MKKVWVDDLSLRSQNLFKELAQFYDNMDMEDIENGIYSKVEDLVENEKKYGFRHCSNPHCKEFFEQGYLTEDSSTFCSRGCAEAIITDIEEADYSEFIFYTH